MLSTSIARKKRHTDPYLPLIFCPFINADKKKKADTHKGYLPVKFYGNRTAPALLLNCDRATDAIRIPRDRGDLHTYLIIPHPTPEIGHICCRGGTVRIGMRAHP